MAIARDTQGGTAGVGTVTSLSVDITSAAIGAQVYCHVQIASNVGATTFANWTLVGEQDEGTSSHAALWTRLKVTGDTTFTVSWTGANNATASWWSATGLDPATPHEGAAQADHTVNNVSYVTATGTPTAANRWALGTFGYRGTTAARTWTNTGTLTQRVDTENLASRWSGSAIGDSNGAVAQSAQSFTATLSAAESHGSSFILFLIPASPAATPGIFAAQNGQFQHRFWPRVWHRTQLFSAWIPPAPLGPGIFQFKPRTWGRPPLTTAFTQAATLNISNLGATLSFTGARPAVLVTRPFAPILSFVGALPWQLSRAWAAGLSFTGALPKLIQRGLPATLGFTGGRPAVLVGKVVAAGLTFTGIRPSLQMARSLVAGLSFTGIRPSLAIVRTATVAALSFVGARAAMLGRPIAAGLSFVGIRPLLAFARPVAAALSFTGIRPVVAIVRVATAATLSFTASRAAMLARALPATLAFVGAIGRTAGKSVVAGLSFVGARPGVLVAKALPASLGFAGATSRLTARSLAAGLSFTGAASRLVSRILPADLTFATVFAAVKSSTHAYFQAFTAALGFTGQENAATSRALAASLNFTSSMPRFITRILFGIDKRYKTLILSQSPLTYLRLGDQYPSAAPDTTNQKRFGTYLGASAANLTMSVAGALVNDADTAVLFAQGIGGSGVNMGNLAAYQISTGTISIWVKTTTTSQSLIVAKLNAYGLYILASGNLAANDYTAGVLRDSGVAINDGAWHHVAMSFQSGVAGGTQMYVDGVAAGAGVQITVLAQTGLMGLASVAGSAPDHLAGTLDEFSLFGSVLTSTQILNQYQAGVGTWAGVSATPYMELSSSGLRAVTHILPAAGLSFVGALSLIRGKLFAAVLSFTGARPQVLLARPLAGGLSFVSAAARLVRRPLAAGLSFTGAVARAVSHGLAATLAFGGVVARKTGKALGAALGFSGAMTVAKFYIRVFNAALSFAGSRPAIRLTHAFAAALSFTGIGGIWIKLRTWLAGRRRFMFIAPGRPRVFVVKTTSFKGVARARTFVTNRILAFRGRYN